MKTYRISKIVIIPSPGCDVTQVAVDAMKLSVDMNTIVEYDFNGVRVSVDGPKFVAEVVNQYRGSLSTT